MARRFCGLLAVALVALLAIAPPLVGNAQTPDRLTIGRPADEPTWDPQSTGILATEIVAANVYETLVTQDAQLRVHPALALSWTMVDPITWEFKLRRGVKFQDGEPFNAQAVAFSFARAVDPKRKNLRASVWRPIKSVVAVDDSTVRIVTEKPWALLLPNLARHGWIVPPAYLQQNGDDTLAQHPIGTGPYKFVSWTKDNQAELDASPTYWGPQPKIPHLTFRVIPDDATRLAELLSGSVDLIDQVTPETIGEIQRSPRLKLVSARASAIFFVNFNLLNVPANRPLMNVQVRQAVQYAVNRALMNQTIMHGASAIVATFCPLGSPNCDPSIAPYPYDPARARAMLQAAGYPNGFDMTLAYTNGAYPGDNDIALALADQLGRVGVRVTPELMDYGLFLSQFPGKKHAQDALLVRVTAQNGYFDDIALEEYTTGGVASYWNNTQFDQVLAAAGLTLDPALRAALLRHAQQIVKDNVPAISLFTAPNADAMNARLNWTPRPDALLTMSNAHW